MNEPIRLSNPHRYALLAVILIASFLLKLNHLGHQSLKPLDESFHAIVAANLLKHPLTPTLNDGPTISIEQGDWYNAGVWLHKPPMALWQIAISYALFGVNTFALRLPSALLSTLSVLLTYLIGRRLFDDAAGLIAAALQAFNPAMIMLVHGYVFSDHVDVSLLFWTEVSIYFLLRAMATKNLADWIICGIAQGLAFLSKTYPALIVTGLAAVLWVLPGRRITVKVFIAFLAATIAMILPWAVWAMTHWPDLFMDENLGILKHLTQDVEGWSAPWDRVLFDYWVRVFHIFYPAIISALVIAFVRLQKNSDTNLWLLMAWAIGVLVPNLLATSKPMTATLVGWPAMWLLMGWLISRAVQGDRLALGAWIVSMFYPLLLKTTDFAGMPFTSSAPMGQALHEHSWVIWGTLICLAGGWALSQFRIGKWEVIVSALAMIFLSFRWFPSDAPRGYINSAWQTTQLDKEFPNFKKLGEFSHTLPANAVLLVEEQDKLDNKLIQFVADRTCYPVRDGQTEIFRQRIVEAGGIPYLVSATPKPLPIIFEDEIEHRTLYSFEQSREK